MSTSKNVSVCTGSISTPGNIIFILVYIIIIIIIIIIVTIIIMVMMISIFRTFFRLIQLMLT